MRIAYFSDILSIHDYRFLKKLCESGYETFLITYTKNDIPEMITNIEGLNILHTIMSGYSERVRTENRFVQLIDKGCRFLKRGYRIFKTFRHFKKVLQKVSPDILHGGWTLSSGFLSALSNFHPFLSMPWGSDILIAPRCSIYNKLIVKFVLKQADMITCDCNVVKDRILDLISYPEEKIVVFPWGVEQDMFNPDVKPALIRQELNWNNKKIIVMNRYFKPIYGIEYFLDALPEIIQNEPDARVVLIGSGPLEARLRTIVKEKGLEGIVHLTGAVDNKDMPGYLVASDIYVSSSLSDGSSLCLLESMSCGLPVVVTDIPANLEWVKNGFNGFIVPRKDSKEIAKKITCLLADRDLRRKMGQRNVAVAQERANWNKNFEKLEKIYQYLYTKQNM